MFKFLRSKKPFEPLDYESRKYFENNFLWLMQEFPEPQIEDRLVLTPTKNHFPINWNNNKESALEAFRIICENMQVDVNRVEIDFYNNGLKEINMGTTVIFMESNPDYPQAAGIYQHKNHKGKYQISIDEALFEKPDSLIATIAHELVHVKLLGEKKLKENDEMLTDFATVFFGFGIFNANAAFQFYQQTDRWGYSNLGYLKIDEWAYALALFAFIRQEDNPEWAQFINKTVKSDFSKSLCYIIDNEDEIFRFDQE